jgi:hypothetical protein
VKENLQLPDGVGNGKEQSMADQLVELANERYRFGRTSSSEVFAVLKAGPNIAKMLRGSDWFRSELAKEYRRTYKRTPNSSALADALNVLCGEGLDAEAETVEVRVAKYDDGIVIDLGRLDGQSILIRPQGWTTIPRSPVIFRRTSLTAELPLPVAGGKLDDARQLFNVGDENWSLLKGWLVGAMVPWIAHPVLMLGGIQGTGKSTAMRMLCGLIDPSQAPLRSEPRDEKQWAITASGSWCIALDNVSHLPAWLSDALCKAVTGDALVVRKLYSDADMCVFNFRRVVGITSIDPGALRGDLADRLLFVELEAIDETHRRSEAAIMDLYAELQPKILGALCDTVAAMLAQLPDVHLDSMPRMADFARVLAALDKSDNSDKRSLEVYLSQHRRMAAEVVDADLVAEAIVALVQNGKEWIGTASDLLEAIRRDHPLKGWPTTPQAMGGRLKRLIPALKAVGVEVEGERSTDRTRTRRYAIRHLSDNVVQVVRDVRNANPAADIADKSDDDFPETTAAPVTTDDRYGEV